MPPSPPRTATTGDQRLSPTVSVVIPALNEEDNLPLVLEGLPPVDEIVIVDGGSADDTVAIAREMRPDALVVRQTRRGKGNALACGFAASSGDIVVVLNADGSTDPGEIPRYVDALLSGAEVAHGSRFRDGGGDLVGHRLDRMGNALLSRFVNALFGTRFTDLGYGYNAYWRALLPLLDLPPIDAPRVKRGRVQWGDGPEIEPLINIRTAAQGMRVVEVASVGYPPINGRSERHRLRRAMRAMRVAFAEYVRRWRLGRRATTPDTARHGTAGRDAGVRAQRAALDDTATRLRREALYDTGTRLRLGSPDDTATRLRREQLYGHRAARPSEAYETGTRIRHEPVSRQPSTPPAPAPPDTGARLRAVPSHDTGAPLRAVPSYDTGARLRAVPSYDTGARLPAVPPYDAGARLPAVPPYDAGARLPAGSAHDPRGRAPADAFHDTGTLSRHQSLYDTGSHLRHDDGIGTGSRARRGVAPDSRPGPGPDSRRGIGSESRRDIGIGTGGRQRRTDTDAGTGARQRHADTDAGTGARQRHADTGAGPWRDLTGAPRRGPEGVVRYDPAADERHDLDPGARHSLPLYPPPDPSWTRSSGRHAAIGDDQDTGVHRRVEPDRRPTGREVGGRRRRLEPWERRVDGRPGLTVLPGGTAGENTGRQENGRRDNDRRENGRRDHDRRENARGRQRWDARDAEAGWEPEGWERRTPDGGRRPGHLRAVPGERSTR
jgi:hypothetical protein